MMLALSYDGALRREELCSLDAGDIDPAQSNHQGFWQRIRKLVASGWCHFAAR